MDLFDHLINIASLCCTVPYNFIKYKLKFVSFNDAIISTCNSLTHKNYFFTKVIQWGLQEVFKDMSLQDNDELTTYFNSFSNRVPYTKSELTDSLSKLDQAVHIATTYNSELKIENMHKPVNSGSVALVFKARLDNTSVIIKVLRKDIKRKIEKDISTILSIFDNVVVKNVIRFYIKADFKSVIESNCEALLDQCNFKNEVNNALIFVDNLKNNKNIVIPHVFTHFTEHCSDVIVMEYIDGDIAKNIPFELFKCHLETLQTLFFDSLFKYNTFHGDFHLGNIIIPKAKENTVAVIDFGIVYTLTNDVSDALFDILLIGLNITNGSNQNNIKLFVKKIINFMYVDKTNATYNKVISNNELMAQLEVSCSNFSGQSLYRSINMLTDLNSSKLEKHSYRLLLSFMSGIQTVEYSNGNKSLKDLLGSYINRSVQMD
jgi:predicted unusual protein kinase regulating ubiquinone biosynthesis (AarF/ABC1/UbiB family)